MFTPRYKLPTDCLDLVHSRDSFVFDDWVASLENVPVFRVSGVTDVLAKFGVKEGRKSVQPLNVIFESLDARVPAKWKKFYPAPTAWKPLGVPQIDNLQVSAPQPLDRALMSVVYVVDFVERVLHEEVPEDFLDLITIVPVLYQLKVDDELWDEKIKGEPIAQRLIATLGHQDNEIIKLAIRDGHRMTWRTADTIREALSDDGHDVKIVCSKGRKPKAIPFEPLYASRAVKHPPVAQYLRSAR
jgi:hypothetical protein